jgi:hypothetical protein
MLLIARWARYVDVADSFADGRDPRMRARLTIALELASAGASLDRARFALGFEAGVSSPRCCSNPDGSRFTALRASPTNHGREITRSPLRRRIAESLAKSAFRGLTRLIAIGKFPGTLVALQLVDAP